MNIKIFEKSWKPTDHDTYTIELSGYAKDKLIKHLKRVEKLEMQKKMLEISFEQINNSRNDLMRQLAEAEKVIEDSQ